MHIPIENTVDVIGTLYMYIYICVCVRDCVWWIMLEKAYSFVTVMRVAICFASKYLVFLLARLCTNIRP